MFEKKSSKGFEKSELYDQLVESIEQKFGLSSLEEDDLLFLLYERWRIIKELEAAESEEEKQALIKQRHDNFVAIGDRWGHIPLTPRIWSLFSPHPLTFSPGRQR